MSHQHGLALVTASMLVAPSLVLAEEEGHALSVEAAVHHDGPPPFRIGLFGMGIPEFEMQTGFSSIHGPVAAAGGGLFFKWAAARAVTVGVVAHVLDVPSHHALELPIDLIAEFPFHLTERFHVYVATGMSVQPLMHFAETGTETHAWMGVLGGFGAEYWMGRRTALFAEVDVAYLRALSGEESAIEPSGSAGVMFAFGR